MRTRLGSGACGGRINFGYNYFHVIYRMQGNSEAIPIVPEMVCQNSDHPPLLVLTVVVDPSLHQT